MTESLQQEIRALRSLYGSERDPEGQAFAPLADAYRRAGDFRQAVELLREGLERHPEFVPGHMVAAQLFSEKGLLQEAEIASRRAVELDAENPVAWALLADVLEAKGAIAQARDARGRLAALEASLAAPAPEVVLEMAELAPDGPVLEMAELAPDGSVLEMAELAPAELAAEPEMVLEMADLAPYEPVLEFAELVPNEPVLEVAELAPEELAAEPEPAFEAAGQAPEDFPSDELPDTEPLVTRTMAELYARQGLTERALGVFRQLLEVSPGDPELRRRVEELETRTSGVEEAGVVAAEEPDVADHQWTSGGLEAQHDVETPFAWTAAEESEETPTPGPTLGAYFKRVLAWEPGGSQSEEGSSSPADDR